jgi:hypothetical protein
MICILRGHHFCSLPLLMDRKGPDKDKWPLLRLGGKIVGSLCFIASIKFSHNLPLEKNMFLAW